MTEISGARSPLRPKPTDIPQRTIQTVIGLRVHWHDEHDLRAATDQWAAKLGVRFTSLSIKDVPGKWGTMDTAGHMVLSRDLLKQSPHLGEYVMLHELTHRLAPNHGQVFKMFLHAYMPDWQSREAELQRNGLHE